MIEFTMAKRAVSIARNNGAIDAIADEISRPSNRNSGHSGMRRTVIASICTRRVDTRVARGILGDEIRRAPERTEWSRLWWAESFSRD